jgi:hypothetical protein
MVVLIVKVIVNACRNNTRDVFINFQEKVGKTKGIRREGNGRGYRRFLVQMLRREKL